MLTGFGRPGGQFSLDVRWYRKSHGFHLVQEFREISVGLGLQLAAERRGFRGVPAPDRDQIHVLIASQQTPRTYPTTPPNQSPARCDQPTQTLPVVIIEPPYD